MYLNPGISHIRIAHNRSFAFVFCILLSFVTPEFKKVYHNISCFHPLHLVSLVMIFQYIQQSVKHVGINEYVFLGHSIRSNMGTILRLRF